MMGSGMARDAIPPAPVPDVRAPLTAGVAAAVTAPPPTPSAPAPATPAAGERPHPIWPVSWLGEDLRRSLAVAWRVTWVSRVLVWVCGVGAFVVFGNQPQGAGFDPHGYTKGFGWFGNALIAPAARWDTTWYTSIANEGYVHDKARPAFFPLYPMAEAAAGWFTGSAVPGGIIVSLAAMLVALTALHRLTELELGGEAARLTLWALALFPMAFFLSAVYSESLFLAFAVGAVLAARTDRWWLAGLLGGLAAATRSAGVLLVIVLVLMLWEQRARTRPIQGLWILLVFAGPALIALWFSAQGMHAFAFSEAQHSWGRDWAGPFYGVKDGAVAAWDGVRQLLSGQTRHVYFPKAGGDPMQVAWRNVVPFGFLLLTVPALIGVFRRLPLSYGIFTLATLALPLSYPVEPMPLMSYGRFVLVLFPLYMWAGAWLAAGPRWRARTVLGASAVGLGVASALFATWFWVA
jgi:hypothetical protein